MLACCTKSYAPARYLTRCGGVPGDTSSAAAMPCVRTTLNQMAANLPHKLLAKPRASAVTNWRSKTAHDDKIRTPPDVFQITQLVLSGTPRYSRREGARDLIVAGIPGAANPRHQQLRALILRLSGWAEQAMSYPGHVLHSRQISATSTPCSPRRPHSKLDWAPKGVGRNSTGRRGACPPAASVYPARTSCRVARTMARTRSCADELRTRPSGATVVP